MSRARIPKPKGGRPTGKGGGSGPEATRPAASGGRLGAHYAGGPAVPLAAPVQRKVTVGRPGDRYEREADAVADRVVRGQPAGEVGHMPAGALGAAQRKAAEPEEEPGPEPVQTMKVEAPGGEPVKEGEEAEPVEGPVQKKEGEPEPEEPVQKAEAETPEEEPVQPKAAEEPEEEPVQAKEDEPEEPVQTKSAEEPEEEPVQKAEAETPDEEPVQKAEAETPEEEPVQKAEAETPEEEPVQQKAAEEPEEEPAQAKAAAPAARARPPAAPARPPAAAVAAQAIRERGPGAPPPAPPRGRLAQGLGNDLGDVRVHDDPRSRAAARDMGARAFTHGRHVWLGPGESAGDTALMAHEAAHVLQQGGVVRRKPRRDDGGAGERRTEPEAGADRSPAPGRGDAAPSPPPGGASRRPGAARPPAPRRGREERSAPAPRSAEREAEAAGPEAGAPEAGAAEPATEGGAEEGTEEGAGGDGEGSPGEGEQASGEGGEAKPGGKSGPGAGKAKRGGGAGAAAGAGDAGGPLLAGEGAAEAQQVLDALGSSARQQKGPAASRGKARADAAGAAAGASAAAPSPENEPLALGKAGQVETMDRKEPGELDQPGFLDLVKAKLRAMEMPANPTEMGRFKERGGASGLRGELSGEVSRQSAGAQGEIASATRAEPAPAAAREPVPLPERPGPPPPADVGAERVVPRPRTDEEVSLDADRGEMEETLGRERLTKERLTRANDPRFSAAQEAREEVHEHAEEAPKTFREEESGILAEEKEGARGEAARGGGAMRSGRLGAEGKVVARQGTQMSAEEAARARVAKDLEGIYGRAQEAVDAKLTWLDGEVDRRFTEGEAAARAAFEDQVEREFDSWKDRRYSGARGKLRWIGDRFRDINELPAVLRIYERGQDLYFGLLDDEIDRIGGVVDETLAWCKERIAAAAKEVKDYQKTHKAELARLGAEAVEDVLGRLEDLRGEVDAKRDELVDKLVQRYQESREKIAARVEEIKQANRSLYVRAKRKIQAVIEAIRNFRRRLMAAIRRAGDVIDEILDDPIGFLKNLIAAVKQGFHQFKENIEEHLKEGVLRWLFGTLAATGIQVPSELSAKAVGGLILQLLGVTYDRVRAKVVKAAGPRAVAVVEKAGSYLSTLFQEGPAGLWDEIKEDLGDLKETVVEEIKSWVITKIVTAAVLKLASMFNPVGAIVQAVLTIYNVVMFFVERIDQILQLVEAVIDSLGKIVRGKIDQAANYIEKALGMALSLIISFLARLMGIGGIADKVRSIVGKVRARVDRAIDKAVVRIVARSRKLAKAGKAVAVKAAAKVGELLRFFPWWRKRSPFRDRLKQPHELFVKGQRKTGVLMVSSAKEQAVATLLESKKTPENEAVIARVNEAYRLTLGHRDKLEAKEDEIKELEKKRDDARHAKDTAGQKKHQKAIDAARPIRDRHAANFETQWAALYAALSQLSLGAATPSQLVKSTIRPAKVAADCRAAEGLPLADLPGNTRGQESSSQAIPSWTELKARDDKPGGEGKYARTWVRMHLVGHQIHGPDEPWNLQAVPQGVNESFKAIETSARAKVRGGEKVLHYRTRVDLHPGTHLPKAVYHGETVAEADTKGEFVEKTLPETPIKSGIELPEDLAGAGGAARKAALDAQITAAAPSSMQGAIDLANVLNTGPQAVGWTEMADLFNEHKVLGRTTWARNYLQMVWKRKFKSKV